jgi:Holliday junction resolvasome RuvABC DNA-binding subunit
VEPGDPRAEAIEAMMNLGYSKSQAASAVLSVEEQDYTTEEYIREALKRI